MTQLFEMKAAVKLTGRQAHALTVLADRGPMRPTALGAAVHVWNGRHPEDARCDYCKSTGNELLRALRKKGVARQRRVDGRMVWQAVGAVEPMGGEIPF